MLSIECNEIQLHFDLINKMDFNSSTSPSLDFLCVCFFRNVDFFAYKHYASLLRRGLSSPALGLGPRLSPQFQIRTPLKSPSYGPSSAISYDVMQLYVEI